MARFLVSILVLFSHLSAASTGAGRTNTIDCSFVGSNTEPEFQVCASSYYLWSPTALSEKNRGVYESACSYHYDILNDTVGKKDGSRLSESEIKKAETGISVDIDVDVATCTVSITTPDGTKTQCDSCFCCGNDAFTVDCTNIGFVGRTTQCESTASGVVFFPLTKLALQSGSSASGQDAKFHFSQEYETVSPDIAPVTIPTEPQEATTEPPLREQTPLPEYRYVPVAEGVPSPSPTLPYERENAIPTSPIMEPIAPSRFVQVSPNQENACTDCEPSNEVPVPVVTPSIASATPTIPQGANFPPILFIPSPSDGVLACTECEPSIQAVSSFPLPTSSTPSEFINPVPIGVPPIVPNSKEIPTCPPTLSSEGSTAPPTSPQVNPMTDSTSAPQPSVTIPRSDPLSPPETLPDHQCPGCPPVSIFKVTPLPSVVSPAKSPVCPPPVSFLVGAWTVTTTFLSGSSRRGTGSVPQVPTATARTNTKASIRNMKERGNRKNTGAASSATYAENVPMVESIARRSRDIISLDGIILLLISMHLFH